jgi:hypothetical protein
MVIPPGESVCYEFYTFDKDYPLLLHFERRVCKRIRHNPRVMLSRRGDTRISFRFANFSSVGAAESVNVFAICTPKETSSNAFAKKEKKFAFSLFGPAMGPQKSFNSHQFATLPNRKDPINKHGKQS